MQSIWPSLLILALVLGAIPLVARLLKRSAAFGSDGRGTLALAGGIAVGPRERVALIRADQKWLVVGITPQSITLLTELDGPPSEAAPARATAPGGGFQDMLRRLTTHERPNR